MNSSPIYSTKQAAELLHVSKSTIYELLKRGELNSYKVGRNIRFLQEAYGREILCLQMI